MKKSTSFWESLEQYIGQVVRRSPLPRYWAWVAVVMISVVMVASWLSRSNSVVGATTQKEVISQAAERGDYQTARALFDKTLDDRRQTPVLGAESELEDKVYPEKVVERRIKELEDKLGEYPGNRQIYLELADLYGQLGNGDKTSEYRESARVLDPNGAEFR